MCYLLPVVAMRLFFLHKIHPSMLLRVFFLFTVTEDEFDLLAALKQSFKESKTQYVATSQDGFPAFGLRSGSDIKRPYRLFLPERLPQQFSVLASVQPISQRGGYLFTVVNPLDTVVQLGVKLSPTEFGTNISLLYTDPLTFPSQVRICTRYP